MTKFCNTYILFIMIIINNSNISAQTKINNFNGNLKKLVLLNTKIDSILTVEMKNEIHLSKEKNIILLTINRRKSEMRIAFDDIGYILGYYYPLYLNKITIAGYLIKKGITIFVFGKNITEYFQITEEIKHYNFNLQKIKKKYSGLDDEPLVNVYLLKNKNITFSHQEMIKFW